MLKVNISGLNLATPVILASGILGISSGSMRRVIDAGAGAVTSKSIGPRPRKGYKNPSIIQVSEDTFINSVGLANPGIDHYLSEIKEIKKQNISLIVSVFGNDKSTYLEVARKAVHAGADAIELNISCPHAEVSSIGTDENLTYSLIDSLRTHIDKPIFVKLNPNVTDICKIAKAAEQAGADGIVAINTMEAMVINVDIQRPILSHGSGGLSGRAIHPIAVKKVFDLSKDVEIPIIGCGGVITWTDAIEFFLAGASAIQIGTALYKGPEIITEIVEGMEAYLRKKEYESIEEIIGLSHQFNLQEVPDFE